MKSKFWNIFTAAANEGVDAGDHRPIKVKVKGILRRLSVRILTKILSNFISANMAFTVQKSGEYRSLLSQCTLLDSILGGRGFCPDRGPF